MDKLPLISQIKTRISRLCGTRSIDQFPGGQPVSFQKSHINALMQQDYYVCEKSDGIRYLLYSIEAGHCFLINRKYEIRLVHGLCLPSASAGFQNETLLDGELMEDALGEGKFQLKFSIFDILLLEGHSVMHMKLNDRLNCVFKHVMNPFKQHQSKFNAPFTLELKQMHKSYGVQEVLKQVIPSLKHENDGLIFTPVNCPYVIGTWNSLLKWKPAHLNSVDFVLSCEEQAGCSYWVLLVQDRRELVFWDHISPVDSTDDWWCTGKNGAVLECVWDSTRPTMVSQNHQHSPKNVPTVQRIGGWKPLRERTDKKTANERSVVLSILQSIEQSVSEEELISHVGEMMRRYKERARSEMGR